MPENGAKLTVFFQEPFWVGLYERWTEGLLQVCKITFGAEPKDYQVYEFLLNHWDGLRFSPPVAEEKEEAPRKNPQAGSAGNPASVGQPAHQHQVPAGPEFAAGSCQRAATPALSPGPGNAAAGAVFALRQKKRKEKHRGR